MNIKEYMEKSKRTEPSFNGYFSLGERARNMMPLLHGTLGLQGEVGEITETIKKHLFYNQKLDIENISEEVGDCLWYIAVICRHLNLDLENIMDDNIKKLKIRYPETFTNELAEQRLDKK